MTQLNLLQKFVQGGQAAAKAAGEVIDAHRQHEAKLAAVAEAFGADAEDRPRLRGHNGRILELLRAGPVLNTRLREISMNHTARISNLRRWLAKHEPDTRVNCRKRPDLGAGVTEYALLAARPGASAL